MRTHEAERAGTGGRAQRRSVGRGMGSTMLRRWWWLPAGLLVAALVASAVGSWIGWVVAVVYVPLNLVGTGMVLREIHDHAPAPEPAAPPSDPNDALIVRRPQRSPASRHERWALVVQVAFVLQLPVGLAVVLVGGT